MKDRYATKRLVLQLTDKTNARTSDNDQPYVNEDILNICILICKKQVLETYESLLSRLKNTSVIIILSK